MGYDMIGARGQKAEAMTVVARTASGEPVTHSSGGSGHTRLAVLDNHTISRRYPHLSGGEQEQIRCRFAVPHLRRAEDMRIKVLDQTGDRQR